MISSRESISGPVPCNDFTNNPQDDLEHNLNEFVAHTKPGAGEIYNNVHVSTALLGMERVVDAVEGRTAFQRGLKMLEK